MPMKLFSAGQRFGRLVVIDNAEPMKCPEGWNVPRSLFRCDCGNEKIIINASVRKGQTKSCGCLQRETAAAHGARKRTHGKSHSRVFNSYNAMKARCYNEKNADYHTYGGAGVTVCERWLRSFDNFLSDMGEPPDGHTLDRKDNSLGYSPDNCRWADANLQAFNQKATHRVMIDGETVSMSEAARRLGRTPAHISQTARRKGISIQQSVDLFVSGAIPRWSKNRQALHHSKHH